MVFLGASGLGVFAVLPALKIPANPLAIGHPSTVDARTAIYGATLAAGLVVVLHAASRVPLTVCKLAAACVQAK